MGPWGLKNMPLRYKESFPLVSFLCSTKEVTVYTHGGHDGYSSRKYENYWTLKPLQTKTKVWTLFSSALHPRSWPLPQYIGLSKNHPWKQKVWKLTRWDISIFSPWLCVAPSSGAGAVSSSSPACSEQNLITACHEHKSETQTMCIRCCVVQTFMRIESMSCKICTCVGDQVNAKCGTCGSAWMYI